MKKITFVRTVRYAKDRCTVWIGFEDGHSEESERMPWQRARNIARIERVLAARRNRQIDSERGVK